ncbi:MAG: right-handed parallel beta-helix repeat-containing protein [Planctomycetota bacterium]
MRTARVLFVAILTAAAAATAVDLFVDDILGDNARTGTAAAPGTGNAGSLRTIRRAIALARPGDTINLVPGRVYAEEVIWESAGGTLGNPVTLAGNGAVIDGSEPCAPDGWVPVQAGVWRYAGAHATSIILVNDRAVPEYRVAPDLAAGEFCYEFDGHQSVLFYRPPADAVLTDQVIEAGLNNGETIRLAVARWRPAGGILTCGQVLRPAWMTVNGRPALLVTAADRLPAGGWADTPAGFCFRPAPGTTPADHAVRRAVRANGLAVRGAASHVTIRDLNVRGVWNDGFNVHGTVTGVRFLNCRARDCGDEGFSAHDASEVELDGGLFLRCSSGVFNVNTAGVTVTRNLIAVACRIRGYGALHGVPGVRHILEHAVLADNPVQIEAGYLSATDVLMVASGDVPAGWALEAAGPLIIDRLTAAGYRDQVKVTTREGPVTVRSSLFPGPAGVWAVAGPDPFAVLGLIDVGVAAGSVLVTMPERTVQPLDPAGGVAELARVFVIRGPDFLRQIAAADRPASLTRAGCTAGLWERYFAVMSDPDPDAVRGDQP